jgi:hypothetical protein
MRKTAQRLLLYAPESEIWNQLGDWPNTAHFASQAGEGLSDVDYQAVLSAVAASI